MRKFTRVGLILTILLIFSSIAFIIGCGGGEKKEKKAKTKTETRVEKEKVIKIGVILPLTGSAAKYGESARNGIMLAYDSLPREEKSRIKLIFGDSKGLVKEAIALVHKYQAQGIQLILGPLSSAEVIGIAPLVERKFVLVISPTASHVKISEYRNVFRICVSDSVEAEVIRQIIAKLEPKVLGVLYWESDWAQGIKQIIEKRLRAKYVVVEEGYKLNMRDFRGILSKMKFEKCDTILLIGAREVKFILIQLVELRYFPYILGTSMFDDPVISEVLSSNHFKYIYPSRQPSWEESKNARAFYENYRKVYKCSPDIFAAFSYDAATVLFKALKLSNFQTLKVRKVLLQEGTFLGVTGGIKFNSNGDNIARMMRIKSNFMRF